MTRFQQLEEELASHNNAYWELGEPVISDPEYDVLMQEFLALNPPKDHPLVTFVGCPTSSERRKVTHDEPMISLDKVYEEEGLLKWALKVARGLDEVFYIGPKFDGISLDFSEGVLSTKKEDVSDKLQYINNAPTEDGRGEVVVLKTVDLPKDYKTTLSAASGIVTTSDQKYSNLLTFIPFTTDREECTLGDLKSINWPATMLSTMQEDYPTDGLVISLKDQEYGETLGGTSHHPFHSIAFKYGNPTGDTKLVDVIWQVGKRKLTPVGIVEPVEIDGFTNTRMSLHNFNETSKLKIGDKITIQRCGQVIPQFKAVLKTFKSSKEISCDTCPACGTATVYEDPNLVCPNDSCGGMLAKRLHDSLTRLGVENIGPAICSELISVGHVNFVGVFEMGIEGWVALPGLALKSGTLRFNDLEGVRSSPMEDFKVLASLNIEGVGLSMAAKICSKMALPEIEACEDFTGIEGVGKITSDKLVEGISSAFGTLRWAKQKFILKETKGLADRPLVCFTGKSDVSRDDWVKIAAEKGYAYNKGVTKKLALLVCADVNSTSTKAEKARKYGTKIMSYEEFKLI